MNNVSCTAGASRTGVQISATGKESHCSPGTTADDELDSKLTNRRSLFDAAVEENDVVDSLYNALKQKQISEPWNMEHKNTQ